MERFPIFLSVVVVFHNQSDSVIEVVREIAEKISRMATDYELIIVDNGSTDETVSQLHELTQEDGVSNLQVYGLAKEVDENTATWAGLENALGDFITVIDPMADSIDFLPKMLEQAFAGADIVCANNEKKEVKGVVYSLAFATFNFLYKRINGVDLLKEAPHYRVLSKRVVNFLLQYAQPAVSYRHLQGTAGFSKKVLNYSSKPKMSQAVPLGVNVDRGIRMLVTSTQAPMRLVTSISLFGAIANLIYCVYIVAISVFKTDVAPGWASLSLQQSGMFFLISLVLLVLGEYILQMASLSNEGPLYYVAQEFNSAKIDREKKLNVEESVEELPQH
jgi:hypothetical protein